MREHFNQELAAINQEILRMSVIVEENLGKSRLALTEQNLELAQQVIKADKEVNELELKISDRLALVLAKESPVAGDLRHIIACLKIVSDIERIGDFAVHAAKRARELAEEQYIKPLVDIPKMLEIGAAMLKDSVQALIAKDETLARRTAARDEEMDSLNKLVYRELLSLMLEDSKTIKQATKLLFLSRVLERLGDHIVHICNWAVYSASGVHEDL